MLYGGEKFVPAAFPCFCLSVFSQNINMLFFNTTSVKSIMVSVDKYFSFRVQAVFLNADKPSSCGMFRFNPTTSIAHKITLPGNFEREQGFHRLN